MSRHVVIAASVTANLSAIRASIDDDARGNSSYHTAADSIAQHNTSYDIILRSTDGDSYDVCNSSQLSGSIQRTYDSDNADIGTVAGNPEETMRIDVDGTDGEDGGGGQHGDVNIKVFDGGIANYSDEVPLMLSCYCRESVHILGINSDNGSKLVDNSSNTHQRWDDADVFSYYNYTDHAFQSILTDID